MLAANMIGAIAVLTEFPAHPNRNRQTWSKTAATTDADRAALAPVAIEPRAPLLSVIVVAGGSSQDRRVRL